MWVQHNRQLPAPKKYVFRETSVRGYVWHAYWARPPPFLFPICVVQAVTTPNFCPISASKLHHYQETNDVSLSHFGDMTINEHIPVLSGVSTTGTAISCSPNAISHSRWQSVADCCFSRSFKMLAGCLHHSSCAHVAQCLGYQPV